MPAKSYKKYPKKIPLNIAIVGGGRACKFFLQLLKNESFPYLNINLVGVCDVNPDAEGLLMARQMGIYTTENFYECPMVKTLRTGESAHVIIDAPVSSNQSGYFEIVTYPVKNANGGVERVIEIHRDITKELSSRWEEKIQKLKEDFNYLIQEDRMISLGKLVASCVHEINNPIQGLMTFSGLMEDILAKGQPNSNDLEEFKHFLSLMTPELERCGKIVSGLLQFSRETALEYKSTNLNDVIEAVIALTRHKMELQHIKLTTRLYPGALWIKGNANRLEQCLLNLVFNAMEAMPEGGKLSVVSGMDGLEQHVLVEIHDTGSGIQAQNLNHIFDPFFTTKVAGQGTGLGLSIVYGIVKNHSGHIRAESEVGQGSSFFLKFPYLSLSNNGPEENHGL